MPKKFSVMGTKKKPPAEAGAHSNDLSRGCVTTELKLTEPFLLRVDDVIE